MSAEDDILGHISRMVHEEHAIRETIQRDGHTNPDELKRLQELSGNLDQAWNLLRQRRASEEFGGVAEPAASGEMRRPASPGAPSGSGSNSGGGV